ncbi:CLUMA_CG001275, isoform A [Clunio marinus]|uniref:CLUMA_CG001275, isoform A n=1 Tax=Clunio marinus TaxID=568069 RepID=A0A1J1HIT9_9DIPT|nr:CLUMA_CG001275, isoform A [Clunio marinus]
MIYCLDGVIGSLCCWKEVNVQQQTSEILNDLQELKRNDNYVINLDLSLVRSSFLQMLERQRHGNTKEYDMRKFTRGQ